MNVDLAQDARATIGEGPVWDERTRRLHWVDIRAGLVHRFSPGDGSDLVLDVGQPVGSLALGIQGGLVLAIRDGFALMPSGSDRPARIVDVERDLANNRMNDGRCDPRGRFWCGTMDWDHAPGAGSLYRLEQKDGAFAVARVLGGLTISNGIDWSPDGSTLYFIDSPTQRVDMFDFDVESGAIRNRRAFVEIPSPDGLPDGLTVDSEGFVWIALFGAGAVRRYTPSGRIAAEIRLPVSLVTSLAFGGPELADLYLTTASHRLDEAQRAAQVHAGSVFVCRPGPTGRLTRRFSWI
ncbi:MAG TPA: SMP-30/gluconolactonase/LRE family protein [Candidatus Limnocylindrales bacterium]